MYGDYNYDKLDALRKWLVEYEGYDEKTVKENTGYDVLEDTYFFKITGKEYMIADDKELFIDCYDEVLYEAQMLPVQFILAHVKNWNEGLERALNDFQALGYEGDISPIILALIGDEDKEHDFDKFVSDAIGAFGAEVFLSGDYKLVGHGYTYKIYEDLEL